MPSQRTRLNCGGLVWLCILCGIGGVGGAMWNGRCVGATGGYLYTYLYVTSRETFVG